MLPTSEILQYIKIMLQACQDYVLYVTITLHTLFLFHYEFLLEAY